MAPSWVTPKKNAHRTRLFNGPALVLYSRKGTDMSKTSAAYVDKFTYQGYSYSKEFYSPDYSVLTSQDFVPDVRVTLYWNPDLIITKEKRVHQISFYNSDECKKMYVVIEGFNSEGQLCHIEKTIEL